MNDLLGLAASVVYVALAVGTAEVLRRTGRVSFDVSRKIVHVAIGTWIVPTAFLFSTRYAAAGPPALFVVLNLLSLRGKWTKAFDAESENNVGTVLFPLSFVILLLTLWDAPGGRAAAAGGLLVLAWGDAAAALVGRRWGRHRYRAGEGWRSFEGSAAMFLFSLLAVTCAGLVVAGRAYPAGAALAAAGVATLLEALSRKGTDNLLVPIGTAFLLWGMGRIG